MAENVIELAEKLRSYIPRGDGYAGEYADTLAAAADALDELEAQRRAWLDESTVAGALVEQEEEIANLTACIATVCELLDEGFDADAPGGYLYDIQAVNQAHRVAAGGLPPRETVEHPCDC